jgi:hypothetical protein
MESATRTMRRRWLSSMPRLVTTSIRENRRTNVSAIRGKMGSDPARMADMTKYLRSPELRAKIASIMPTDEARRAWTQRLMAGES